LYQIVSKKPTIDIDLTFLQRYCTIKTGAIIHLRYLREVIMLSTLKSIWFCTKVFFTSIMALWRFIATLACGAALEFSAPGLYTNLMRAKPEPWDTSNVMVLVLSFILAGIILWGALLRNKETLGIREKMKGDIDDLHKTLNTATMQNEELKKRIKNLENPNEVLQGDFEEENQISLPPPSLSSRLNSLFKGKEEERIPLKDRFKLLQYFKHDKE